MHRTQASFGLRYSNQFVAHKLPAHQVLGIVGYGAERPVDLPPAFPFMAAPLLPVSVSPAFEIWTAASSTRPRQIGAVTGACSDELAFGGVRLEEDGAATLEAAAEKAYAAIFDFLEQTGFRAPIRFWNYLTAIAEDDRGLERYRRFNIGRHRAFMARLHQPVPPAASCVGAYSGASMIYFLAARESARAIENPRQISAYAYPPVYGPRSPSFSRAGLYDQGGVKTLFISGTASIVGHETLHRGDLPAQIAETLENLRVLVASAGQSTSLTRAEDWALKIYLRDRLYLAAVEPAINALFGVDSQRIYLHAEICRPDLLVEIEAFHQASATVPA